MVLEYPWNTKVGNYYWVPCIQYKKNLWLPICGPLHEDTQFLNFPDEHWHYDPRFLSDAAMTRMEVLNRGEKFILVHIANKAQALSQIPQLKLRKCRRTMPDFPWEIPIWQQRLARLEDAYRNHHINLEKPICPHKGLPLLAAPNTQGIVVCSGHGLSWNLNTGCLVPRAIRPTMRWVA